MGIFFFFLLLLGFRSISTQTIKFLKPDMIDDDGDDVDDDGGDENLID